MSSVVSRDFAPASPFPVDQLACRPHRVPPTAADAPAGGGSCLTLSEDVAAAVLLLQERRELASKYAKNNRYRTDLCDRAMDALLRYPDRTGDPQDLAKKALSNVRNTVRSRAQKTASMDALAYEPEDRDDQLDRLLLDLGRVLSHPMLRASDRIALCVKLRTDDDADVAAALGVPTKMIPVRLTRARSRAKAIWESMQAA